MTSGEQNNKLVINTLDLPGLWELKFHSIPDLTLWWVFVSFSEVFVPFLNMLAGFKKDSKNLEFLIWNSPRNVNRSTKSDGVFRISFWGSSIKLLVKTIGRCANHESSQMCKCFAANSFLNVCQQNILNTSVNLLALSTSIWYKKNFKIYYNLHQL